MPGVERVGLKLRQVGAVAFPNSETDFPVAKSARWKHWLRKRAAFNSVLVAAEIIAEHNGPAAKKIGKLGVVLKLRTQFLQGRLKLPDVLQPGLGQLFQHRQAGAVVGLGKHDVEPDE